ncbi:hypothetical protein ACFOHT_23610 [Massilia oculi]|uniref:hypothetical protein n=1 Tax=Massilia oculi TaxID=945844 RepID=UPI001E4C3DF5|nr:hypothetical protein [Massilia oculi]
MQRTIPLILAALLALGATTADAGIHYACEAARGKCPKPPVPPPPPAPPAPPAPPEIDLPEIPAAFHAACEGKQDGARLNLTMRPGEGMGGVCENEGGKMVFHLRSYHRAD